ncbi:MAG: LCP family protein [Clostridiales bacterium]|nr:LCP family protein [Clostridiales bacterium]
MAELKKNAAKRKKRKLILFIIEIAILAVVLVALYFYQKLNLLDTSYQVDESQIQVNDVEEDTLATFEGYTTIAVFGLDNRTQGAYSSGNSDVIIILNINNDTKEMSMVSVYRDTYLNVAAVDEDDKFRKCNSAYAYGGVEQAITMLNRNLDLDIDNYLCVDFGAVAEAINILGGVEIDIESEEELYWLNAYMDDTNRNLGTDEDYVSGTGTQTLTGVQAVAYSRIRYTSGNDYKRAERQRRVISQMFEKAKSANLSQINELIDTVFPDIQTDLSKKDILTMATAFLNYDLSSSGGFPYYKTTMTISSTTGDVVVPLDLESNVIVLHEQLFGTENYTPSSTVQEYSDYIIDMTGLDADDAVEDSFTDSDDFTGSGDTDSNDSETDDDSEDDEE